MSKTYRHDKAAKLKDKLQQLNGKPGPSIYRSDYLNATPEYMDALDEWQTVEQRHGNKRRYEAGMKQKRKKSRRMQENEHFRGDW